MDRHILHKLLQAVQQSDISIEQAIEQFALMPFAQIADARVDHHRALRRGFAEVIYGEYKTPAQVATIFEELAHHNGVVLCTRARQEHADAVATVVSGVHYHAQAKCLYRAPQTIENRGRGTIALLCAGTADLPVAYEAMLTAQLMGNHVELYTDIGVAGLHRLLAELPRIRKAEALIVVAGMEGALPSVVAGLCDRPLFAVPTSVGYGTSLQGWGALLSMLNACSAGISVVNIDNGFGAGYAASLSNRKRDHSSFSPVPVQIPQHPI